MSGWLRADEAILDLGCGVGRFAEFILAHGKKYAFGVDYSEVAVDQAKRLLPDHAHKFSKGDLYDPATLKLVKYDVAVLLEVLEHLGQDMKVVEALPPGKRVILSLPSFDYASHFRHFASMKDCVSRYKELLDVVNTADVDINENKIWLLDTVRRSNR